MYTLDFDGLFGSSITKTPLHIYAGAYNTRYHPNLLLLHQSINRLGNNASVAHQSTCIAFADEFMGDLINKALYQLAPNADSLKLYAYL